MLENSCYLYNIYLCKKIEDSKHSALNIYAVYKKKEKEKKKKRELEERGKISKKRK